MILFKAKWASSITPIAKISWNMMDWYPFGIEKYIIYINLTVLCDSQIIESTCSFKCKSNPLNFIEMVVLQCKLGVHVSMSCKGYLPFWFRYSVSNINSEHIQWYLLMNSGSKLIWIHSHCDHLSVLACICSLWSVFSESIYLNCSWSRISAPNMVHKFVMRHPDKKFQIRVEC